jgi:hypothetical protein
MMTHIDNRRSYEGFIHKEEFDNVDSINAKPTVGTVDFAEIPGSSDETEDSVIDDPILSDTSNLHKLRRDSVSNSKNFIKYIPSEKSSWLRKNHTALYLLLSLAAERARWENTEYLDGLIPGDAILGNFEEAGITRQQYRDAIEKGEKLGIWEVVWNQKSTKHQKRTIKRTIKSIVVNIRNSDIWDINLEKRTICGTMREPSENHKQERKERKERKELLFCIPDQVVGKSQKNEISKKVVEEIKSCKKRHVSGIDVEIFFDDIIRQAIHKKTSWTTEEIKQAWNILVKYKGIIRNGWLFIEGTLKNIKNKKSQEFINKGKKCSIIPEKKKELQEIIPSENTKKSTLADDSRGRPSLQSLLEKSQSRIK